MLEMISGRMRSFSMRMRISPGKPKYCLWRWDRDAYSLTTRPKPIPEKSEGRSQIKSRLRTKNHRMSKKTTIMFKWMQKWKCYHHIITEAGMVCSSQHLLNSFNSLHFDWLHVFICVYICKYATSCNAIIEWLEKNSIVIILYSCFIIADKRLFVFCKCLQWTCVTAS